MIALHRRLARDHASPLERLLILGLAPASWVYHAGFALRQRMHAAGWLRVECVDLPVIAIGGLAAGGSGKTPLAAVLATLLAQRGRQPLLVAHGYRSRLGPDQARLVSRGREPHALPSVAEVGDEALLLARLAPTVPVAAARRRSRALEVARAQGVRPDVLILDGGVLQPRLKLDVGCIALDASRPPGSGHLLPWGDLRAPWSALQRVAAVLLHRRELCPDPPAWLAALQRCAPQATVAWSENRLLAPRPLSGDETGTIPWQTLRSRRVGLWSALGHPAAFAANLAREGIEPVYHVARRDHAAVGPRERQRLGMIARRERIEAWLMTEKDAVKWRAAHTAGAGGVGEMWVVPARVELTSGRAALLERLWDGILRT